MERQTQDVIGVEPPRQRRKGRHRARRRPRLIIADEPTTNLDVTIQAQYLVEAGTVRELFNAPQHPCTKALIGSMPKLGSKAKLFAIPGQPPDLATLPPGYAFHPRCPQAPPRCAIEEPPEVQVGGSWSARCWLAEPQGSDSAKEVHAAAAAAGAAFGLPLPSALPAGDGTMRGSKRRSARRSRRGTVSPAISIERGG